MSNIKLFVGCAPNGEDAESMMVLEYSLKKNCSMPVDIEWMMMSHDPESHWYAWNTEIWSTPFSGYRWGVPSFCNYEGQAIYMDSDMIILHDLAELWNEPFHQNKVIQMKGGWRTCVSKFNNEKIKELIDSGNWLSYERIKMLPNSHHRLFSMLQSNPHLVQNFDRQWNNFDGENDPIKDIKILHYTDMSTQMHIKYAIPRLKEKGLVHWYDGDVRQHRRQDVIDLFDTYYNEALEAGYKVSDYEPNEPFGDYVKLSQRNYHAANGFDVTRGE